MSSTNYKSAVEAVIQEQRERRTGVSVAEQEQMTSDELAELDAAIQGAMQELDKARAATKALHDEEVEKARQIALKMDWEERMSREVQKLETARARKADLLEQKRVEAVRLAYESKPESQALLDNAVAFYLRAKAVSEAGNKFRARAEDDWRRVFGTEPPPGPMWQGTPNGSAFTVEVFSLVVKIDVHADGSVIQIWAKPLNPRDSHKMLAQIQPGADFVFGQKLSERPDWVEKLKAHFPPVNPQEKVSV